MNKIIRSIITAAFIVFPFIALILLFITLKNQLHPDDFFIFTDSAFIISAHERSDILSLWKEHNLGYIRSIYVPSNFFSKVISSAVLSLFPNMNMMVFALYLVLYTAIFYSAWYFFHQIQKELFDTKKLHYSFLSAVFYSFNIVIIHSTGILDSIFPFILVIPIFFLLTIRVIKEKEISPYNLFTFSILVALTTYAPPFAVPIYLLLFPFWLTLLRRDLISKYYATSVVLTIGMSLFFMYPFFHAYFNIMSETFFARSSSTNYIFLTDGLKNIYRLFLDWTIRAFYDPLTYHPYQSYYSSAIVLFAAFITWAGGLYGLIKYKGADHRKIKILIAGMIIGSLFFLKGDQYPLGFLNLLLYKVVPLFGILRTPSSKFNIILAFIIGLLILFFLNYKKNKIVGCAVFIIVFLQVLPFFNTERFLYYQKNSHSKYIGRISSEMKKVVALIDATPNRGYVLMYPGISSAHYKIEGDEFISQDLLGKLLTSPVIYNDDTTMSFAEPVIEELYKKFSPDKLGETNTKFIVLRKYIDSKYEIQTYDIAKAKKIIESYPEYTKIYDTHFAIVYKHTGKQYKDFITVENDQDTTLKIVKKNSTEYTVTIPANKIKDFRLIMRNTFHQDWHIEGNFNSYYNVSHEVYNSYANSWLFSKKNVSVTSPAQLNITIYYAPQRIFLFLASLSSLFLLGSLGYIILLRRQMKHNSTNKTNVLK